MARTGFAWSNPYNSSYTNAFIREVLRFKLDAVNATRMVTKDLELGGYRVAKGLSNEAAFFYQLSYR